MLTEEQKIENSLSAGEIIDCQKYTITRNEIMEIALSISKKTSAKGIITIGWSTTTPQICLNFND